MSIETGKDLDIKDILSGIRETGSINFTDFSVNKSASGLFIQLKFENMTAEKSIELPNKLQKDSEINKIYWNK